MIISGKRAAGVIPVAEKGDSVAFSVALTGNTIKTVYEFVDFGWVSEILIKVPTLTGAVFVCLTLHDAGYQAAADARYTSPALGEAETHTVRAETLLATVMPFKRFVVPGDTLRVAANAGAGTETVEGVLIIVGV